MDRLNYFASFQRQLPEWENQITRAFLVMLRHVPMARAIFVEFIREQQRICNHLSNWHLPPYLLTGGERIDLETQVGRIEALAEGRLTSIVMSDQGEEITEPVRAVDRQAVYDGVFCFGDQVVVIENKPRGSSGARQVNPALAEGERFEINPHAVVIVWRELLAALSGPLLRQDITGAEAIILRDFLDYIQEKAPQLYPYSRLGMCGDSIDLLNNRLRQIMEELAPEAVKYHQGWGHYIQVIESGIRMVKISAERRNDEIFCTIALYPGDSQRQAKQLYRQLDVDALLRLPQSSKHRQAWEARPNFHLGYRASNICYPETGEIGFEGYVRYWQGNQSKVSQQKRGDDAFEGYFQSLLADRIISSKGLVQLRNDVASKRYDRLNVCPGIALLYRMPLEEAVRLDQTESLRGRLLQLIDEAFATWRQDFIPSQG